MFDKIWDKISPDSPWYERFLAFDRWLEHRLSTLRRLKYSLLRPSNKLTIRNIPRTYVEREERLFHAVMTVFCDFIEKEYDSLSEFVECNCSDDSNWKEEAARFVDIYGWYKSTNWKDPVPATWPEDLGGFAGYRSEQITNEYPGEGGTIIAKRPMYRLIDCATSDQQAMIDKYHAAEEKFNKLCHDNLKFIVEHYRYLWR